MALLNDWLLPVSILSGSVLFAFLFEIFFFRIGFRHISLNTWWSEKRVIRSLKVLAALLFIIIGAYIALIYAPVSKLAFHYIKKILISGGIMIASILASRIGVGLIKIYTRSISHSIPASSILSTISKIIIYSIGLLIILQTLGISITPILTALGVGGLAVALALQDTLSNLFAGFHLIISRNFRPGDYIKLGTGEEGNVQDINWRNTVIKAPANNLIIVPNSKIATSIITNFTLPKDEVVFTVPVTLAYSSDILKAETVAIDAARKIMTGVTGGIPDFIPLVRFNSFAESGIGFNVIMKALNFDAQFLLKHEFIKLLHERFKEEKIEMAVPARHVRVENKI